MTVIGAGSYGTAMAIALSCNGSSVLLWGRNKEHINNLKLNRSNSVNLPGILFPDSLLIESSLSNAVNACKNLLIAVPSHSFDYVLMQLQSLNNNGMNNNLRIIIASKGLDPKTGCFLKDIVLSILGDNVPLAIISGPTFSKELAAGLPTAITLASTDAKFGDYVKNLLSSVKNLRVYKSTDIIGIQIAGAIKNVIAIGVGISDGMGFGANARTALITRGLAEMARLGKTIGATSEIFMGLAGLGDLVLTCTDNQSRNRRFGILLGTGMSINLAKKNIGEVIEGIYNTREVYKMSIRNNVQMPITEQVYKILYNNKNIHDAARDLLNRAYTEE